MFWKNTKKCQLAKNMLVGANWWRDISPIMLQWHISLHQCPLTSWFLPRGLLFVLFTSFWKCVESYYFVRSKQLVHVNLKEILIDILTSECPLLPKLSYTHGENMFMELQKKWSASEHRQFYKESKYWAWNRKIYFCTKNKSLQKLIDKWTS